MKKLFLTFLTVSVICIWTSCTECDPISEPTTSLNVKFLYKNEAGAYEELDSLVFQSVRGIYYYEAFEDGTPRDPDVLDLIIGIDSVIRTSYLPLPLSFDRDSSIFRFLLADNIHENAETLRVYHKHQLVINAPDCGYSDVYSNLEVKGSFFDSVHFNATELTADPSIMHLEVFINDSIPGI